MAITEAMQGQDTLTLTGNLTSQGMVQGALGLQSRAGVSAGMLSIGSTGHAVLSGDLTVERTMDGLVVESHVHPQNDGNEHGGGTTTGASQ